MKSSHLNNFILKEGKILLNHFHSQNSLQKNANNDKQIFIQAKCLFQVSEECKVKKRDIKYISILSHYNFVSTITNMQEEEVRSTVSSSQYSSQDDNAKFLTQKAEQKLLSLWVKLKNKDPSVNEISNPVFKDDDFQQQNGKNKLKEKKKYTYKDMINEQGSDIESQPEKPENDLEKIKQSFKQKLNGTKNQNQQNNDDLFKVKEKKEKVDKTYEEKLKSLTSSFKDKKSAKMLENMYGMNKMDDKDLFLMKYILDKKWISSNYKEQLKNSNKIIDEQDQERSLQMDQYEAKHNFRYQQPGAAKITQHPRNIQQSLRIKPETRKEKRKKRLQQKKQEEKAMREEAQRLKAEKKEQILTKLGVKNEQSDNDWFFCDDCTRPFHENQLCYVCQQCEDFMLCEECNDLIIHKHPLNREQIPKGYGPPAQEKALAMIQQLKSCGSCRKKIPQQLNHYEFLDKKSYLTSILCEKCYDDSELKVKKKYHEVNPQTKNINFEELLEKDAEKIKEIMNEKDVQDLVDEYLKYDFQDVGAGGLKTKFKYVSVKPESYGLSDQQILYGDDKELNKYISIKKMVPYRDEQVRLRNSIYNKKIKPINKSVKDNKKLIGTKKVSAVRGLKKMQARAEILKKRRQNKTKKLKIINLSKKEDEKKYFMSNSRLSSYGIASNPS